MSDEILSGVFAPVLTPFDATLAPDRQKFVRFCQWLIDEKEALKRNPTSRVLGHQRLLPM